MFMVHEYEKDGPKFTTTYHETLEEAESKGTELTDSGVDRKRVQLAQSGGFEYEEQDLPRNQIYCPNHDPLIGPRVVINLRFRDWIKRVGSCRCCGTIAVDYKDITQFHIPDSTIHYGYKGGGYRSFQL